jgi:hypothetical protein
MKLFSNLIRAIERNSRSNERKHLTEELQDIYIARKYDDDRARWIIERLHILAGEDLSGYLNRNSPIKSVSDMVKDEVAA